MMTAPIASLAVAPSTAADSRRIRLAFSLLAAIVLGMTLFVLAPQILQDPDSWWHVRTGQDMLATWTFPTVDAYSYTFAGHPWIAKEWLAQVLFALAYDGAAWNGVAVLTAIAILSMVFLLCWHLSEALKPAVAFGSSLVLAFLIDGIFTARPHIFTLPIIVVWTAFLFRAARADRAPPFWLLALLWLWTNVHATFTLGFVIAAFAGLDFLVRNRLTKPALLARWCLFGALCPVVSLLNPYGVKAILATFTVAYGNEAVPYITEWQPFSAAGDPLHEAALLAMAFGLLASGVRIGWPRALFVLFALHLYLTHQRFSYVFFLLVPLVLAPDIAEQFPGLSAQGWVREKRDGLERLVLRCRQYLPGAMAAALIGGFVLFATGSRIEPGQKTSAKSALAFAAERGLSGPVLNSYDFGGTLIFHGIKTFIDGRTDQLFLGGFTQADEDMGTSAGKPLIEALLGKYAIDWALLSSNDKRIPFFDELPDWKRVYADPYAVIYVRD